MTVALAAAELSRSLAELSASVLACPSSTSTCSSVLGRGETGDGNQRIVMTVKVAVKMAVKLRAKMRVRMAKSDRVIMAPLQGNRQRCRPSCLLNRPAHLIVRAGPEQDEVTLMYEV